MFLRTQDLTGFVGKECGEGYFTGVLTVRQTVLREEKAVKHTCTHHSLEIPRRAPAGLMDGVLLKQNMY